MSKPVRAKHVFIAHLDSNTVADLLAQLPRNLLLQMAFDHALVESMHDQTDKHTLVILLTEKRRQIFSELKYSFIHARNTDQISD